MGWYWWLLILLGGGVLLVLLAAALWAVAWGVSIGLLWRRVMRAYQSGDYEQALSLAEEYHERIHQVIDDNHPFTATSLSVLALLRDATGRHAEAEPLFRRALEVLRTALGERHPDFADSLSSLAFLLLRAGRHAEAEPLFRRALEVRRAASGEAHPLFAISLSSLALPLQKMGRHEEAEPLLRRALEVRRAALGERHPDFADSLNNLAFLLLRANRLAEAEPLYRRALEVRRAALGEAHPHFADSLNNLASLLEDTGRRGEAEPLYRRALEVRRAALGEAHPHFADSLNNLASLLEDTGRRGEAEPLYRRALEVRRAALGEAHPDFARSLSCLANLLKDTGRFDEAEPLYRRALEVRRAALGEAHPLFAISLSCLASLLEATGRFDEAEPLYRRALEVKRAALGEAHPDFATGLNNLGNLLAATGRFDEAEPLLRRALEVQRPASGEAHHLFARSLNNLALLLEDTGRRGEAEPLLRRALEVQRAALGEAHPHFAISLNNLASLLEATGRFDEAEPLYRRALEVKRAALGEAHPDFATGLNNLAGLCAATGRAPEAASLIQRAFGIEDSLIGRVFPLLTDAQRLAFLGQTRTNLEIFLSLVTQYLANDPTAVRAAFDTVLRRKALTAEAQIALRRAVLSGRYPHLREPLSRWCDLLQQITLRSLQRPRPSEDAAERRQALAALQRQCDRLEADLAAQVPEVRLQQQLQAADRHAVALHLPEGVTLIEFVRYDVFDFHALRGRRRGRRPPPARSRRPRRARGERRWKPARYLAFVLPAHQPDDVQMIDLGEADEIDQLIDHYRAEITGREDDGNPRRLTPEDCQPPPETANDPGRLLRQRVFDPVAKALPPGCRCLILAPDGALAYLPFEVLPGGGGWLIDDYQVCYVATGRDVLRFAAAPIHPPSPPLVVAAPNFDFDGPPGPTTTASLMSAAQPSSCHAGSLPRVEPLVGAEEEGKYIAKRLSVRPLTGDDALARGLKEVRSPHILHLATHGFFLADQPTPHQVAPDDFADGLWPVGEDPLLRSGLLLAGYNAWLEGRLPEEVGNGMLTAKEVTGLDLTDTELVVLSACDTGLGEVRAGEGVFGLRRAFTVAGARTLVMSLWKVRDDATQELMVAFYERILAGEPKAEALRQAQLSMKARHPQPLFWAAFICQGDPGPLRHLPGG